MADPAPATDDIDIPPGWTDIHIHPVKPEWSLPLSELPGLLERLGASTLIQGTAHRIEDVWDAEDEAPEPLAQVEQALAADIMTSLALPGVKHLNLVLDPAEVGMLDALADLRQSVDNAWAACAITLNWGRTTIPTHDASATAADFQLSMAFSGPGLPKRPGKSAKQLLKRRIIQAHIDRFDQWLRTPCQAHVCFADQ